MSKIINIETGKANSLALDIAGVAHVSLDSISDEEQDILTFKLFSCADMQWPVKSAKDVFNQAAQSDDFFRLDGNYQKGHDASYLIRPKDVDYIISSAPYDSQGVLSRGVIVTGKNLWIDGLKITEEAYQDLVKEWRAAKGEGNVLHILPEVVSARFVEPGEVLLDHRDVIGIDSGQSGDRSVDIYFRNTGARIDFNLTKAASDVAELSATIEIERLKRQAGGELGLNEINKIWTRCHQDAARDILSSLVTAMPQLEKFTAYRGDVYFDPSEIVALSKHDKGYNLYLKNKKDSLGYPAAKQIFLHESSPKEVEEAYQKAVRMIGNNVKKPNGCPLKP
jgi:hypothetical protein